MQHFSEHTIITSQMSAIVLVLILGFAGVFRECMLLDSLGQYGPIVLREAADIAHAVYRTTGQPQSLISLLKPL